MNKMWAFPVLPSAKQLRVHHRMTVVEVAQTPRGYCGMLPEVAEALSGLKGQRWRCRRNRRRQGLSEVLAQLRASLPPRAFAAPSGRRDAGDRAINFAFVVTRGACCTAMAGTFIAC
jgi:hypothetical protein